MTTTLHWHDTNVEVHKLGVGPYDNNVFVIRCRATGDAVLIDAANEHEKLLELCTQLGVRRVLETRTVSLMDLINNGAVIASRRRDKYQLPAAVTIHSGSRIDQTLREVRG